MLAPEIITMGNLPANRDHSRLTSLRSLPGKLAPKPTYSQQIDRMEKGPREINTTRAKNKNSTRDQLEVSCIGNNDK